MILEKGLRVNPQNPYLANNLACLYMKYKPSSINKAMRVAQTAFNALPRNPAIVDTMGWVYFHKGMYTRSIWLLEEASKLAPGNQLIRSHLKIVYSKINSPTQNN